MSHNLRLAVNYSIDPTNNNHSLPHPEPQERPLRAAIIGAGATGLAALRVLSEPPRTVEATVFERSDRVGGLWNYARGEGPMYESLRTNLCAQGMMFPGFPFPFAVAGAYPTHREMARYLQAFADSFDAARHIRFQTSVQLVEPADDPEDPKVHWRVVSCGPDGVQREELFHAVFVCNGHFDIPRWPDITGLHDHFPGEVIHSRDFDTARHFRGRRVLVLGAANSGQDIALDIASEAAQVLLSHNGPPLPSSLPPHVAQVPGVVSCEPQGLRCVDGRLLPHPDALVCATGYEFGLSSLLSPSCGVRADQGCVWPLYQQLVNARRPSMFLLGLLNDVAQFPMYHCQALAARAAIEGRWRLPDRAARLRAAGNDLARALRLYGKARHLHLMRDEQWRYNAQLCAAAGYDPRGLPQVVREVFNTCWLMRRTHLASFRSYNVLVDADGARAVIRHDKEGTAVPQTDLDTIQALNEGRSRHPAAVGDEEDEHGEQETTAATAEEEEVDDVFVEWVQWAEAVPMPPSRKSGARLSGSLSDVPARVSMAERL